MADHSNLPAPYESPWRQLGRAAGAVVASLGLDLRGLWRRNRSGELPRLGWWPRDLAPLFWPLVLAAALALVLPAAGWLAGLQRQPQQAAAPLTTAAEASDASKADFVDVSVEETFAATVGQTAEKTAEETAEETAEKTAQETTEQTTEVRTEETALQSIEVFEETFKEPLGDIFETPKRVAVSADADPGLGPGEALRDRISVDDRERWIMAAEARPARQLVVLQLEDGFNRQDPPARRRLAEHWLERIQGLGFEQLELRSPDGELLGYRARVGSGMILLEPAASA